ncbi:hypothetical protein CsSME_00014575 [Camellia sinensis var. sinensis]
MERGSGHKISKIVDDFTSLDLQIAKGQPGPVFMCRETETMFILTANLRGYKRENMKVEVNEDGAWIVASGERPVQETVMVAKEVYKKEIKMRGFRKAFKIPDGTILDKIKAGFDEEELVLTISMPKLVKGIHGIRIEEVKEEKAARGSFKSLQITANRVDERETLQQEEYREPERQDTTQDVIEPKEDKHGREDQDVKGKENEREKEKEKNLGDQSTQASPPSEKRSKQCVPIMAAGSAFLVSIIVLVIHLIRTKTPPSKKKQ